jgi:putative membrane protein
MAMSSNSVATFFSPEEQDLIRQAVVNAEETTAGEVATMVVDASDSYREAETLGSVLLAGLVAVVVAVASHHVTIWSYIPLVLLLFLPVRLVFRRWPRLKLPFVGPRRLQEAVRERAVQAFYERGLYRTKDGTGILIFLSLLEHKVWILGDRGINERIDPGQWSALTADLARGLRNGRGGEALCDTVRRCGDLLARHFPRRADDRNELPDELIS